MNYKVNLAARMLFNKRGSLAGAILAVTIGILVIHVNFVIFQGLFDAIVRDISDYNNGDILITSEESFITKSDLYLVNWFNRIPEVDAAASRLYSTGTLETSNFGKEYFLNQVFTSWCRSLSVTFVSTGTKLFLGQYYKIYVYSSILVRPK